MNTSTTTTERLALSALLKRQHPPTLELELHDWLRANGWHRRGSNDWVRPSDTMGGWSTAEALERQAQEIAGNLLRERGWLCPFDMETAALNNICRAPGTWVPFGDPLREEDGFPVIPVADDGEGRLAFWCRWCRREHLHGAGGHQHGARRPSVGYRYGHKTAHCTADASPYRRSGYFLELASGREGRTWRGNGGRWVSLTQAIRKVGDHWLTGP